MVKRILAGVLGFALRLLHALRDERTPAWAKGVVVGMAGYIVWPLDLVPDVAPVVGWGDDLVALVAAIVTLLWYSRGEPARRARDRARQMLRIK